MKLSSEEIELLQFCNNSTMGLIQVISNVPAYNIAYKLSQLGLLSKQQKYGPFTSSFDFYSITEKGRNLLK